MTTPVTLDSLQPPQCVQAPQEEVCSVPAASAAAPGGAAAIDSYVGPSNLVGLIIGLSASNDANESKTTHRTDPEIPNYVSDLAARFVQRLKNKIAAAGEAREQKTLGKSHVRKGIRYAAVWQWEDAAEEFQRAATKFGKAAEAALAQESPDHLFASRMYRLQAGSYTRKSHALIKANSQWTARDAEMGARLALENAANQRLASIAADAVASTGTAALDELARALKLTREELQHRLRDRSGGFSLELEERIGPELTVKLADKASQAPRDGREAERREKEVHVK